MTNSPASESSRQLLRHAVATLAYRGGKAFRGAPADFSSFQIAAGTRTPGQILAHIGDELDWVLSQARGKEVWRESPPRSWDEDVARFYAGLDALDAYLASSEPLVASPERLFQGAIADVLTHIGQISMLRRLAGSPVRAENYSRADIVAGRVGTEQTPPEREF
jgi:hypothetical protein